MSPAMDPDRYQMRSLKRRISKLEDQIGYLKTDWKRTTTRLNEVVKDLEAYLVYWRESMPSRKQ